MLIVLLLVLFWRRKYMYKPLFYKFHLNFYFTFIKYLFGYSLIFLQILLTAKLVLPIRSYSVYQKFQFVIIMINITNFIFEFPSIKQAVSKIPCNYTSE